MVHVLITFGFIGMVICFHLPEWCIWLAPGFFIGRELAQAEYRYIKTHGGKRANCPWYCGFLPSAWTLKSLLDWVLPLIVSTFTAILW